MTIRVRRSLIEETRGVAVSVGQRLRDARKRARLTQQQLAGERYTKAYVSALENGLVKPSVAALTYLADRLGIAATDLLADPQPRWRRLHADLLLASGDWQAADDEYAGLLSTTGERRARAELLRGRAEALCRLDRPTEAAPVATESAEIFLSLDDREAVASARYWLAFAHYQQENSDEARALLGSLLDEARAGLRVTPDFLVRLLVARAMVESRDGEHEAALAYLHEAQGLARDLDDRRRATFLFGLALSYREVGDLEASLRAGAQALPLFEAAGSRFETASLENELALTYLALGNQDRAAQHVAASLAAFAELHDDRWVAHAVDTKAQIELAAGHPESALITADEAIRRADAAADEKAQTSALVTRAKILASLGRLEEAAETYERAVAAAKASGRRAWLQSVYEEWADVLAKQGRLDQAYAVTREALRVGRA